jgi:hypothetical protein
MTGIELFGLTSKDGTWLGSQKMDVPSDERFEYYADYRMEEVYKGSHVTMLLFLQLLKVNFGIVKLRLSVLPPDMEKYRRD